METLESLGERLRTTADIQAIVRTMKALSAASIRQYELAEDAVADFERTIDLGLSAVLRERRSRGLSLPVAGEHGSGAEAVLVIGSDRGLCGPYNEVVVARAAASLGTAADFLVVLGVRAAAKLEALGHSADRTFMLPATAAGMPQLVRSIIIEIERWSRQNEGGRVRLVHNHREGRSHAVPTERTLLPLPAPYLAGLTASPWRGPGLPFFRMQPERLLSWLVQQRIFVVLYRALAEALASEHATRLAAMQRAERNIEERRGDLDAAFRRKRQETITRELMDLIAGFEAVRPTDE